MGSSQSSTIKDDAHGRTIATEHDVREAADAHEGAAAGEAPGAQEPPAASGFVGQMPSVEALLAEVIATLALASHAYLDRPEEHPDFAAAQIAIDVATTSFERVKERLRPEERLSITQMLTETRMNFVRKRGT